jgi:apolipoprotein N-acyltransferase
VTTGLGTQSWPTALASRVSALRAKVRTANGWTRILVAVGSGVACVLALAPFYIWPTMFLTLPVLVWMIDDAAASDAPTKSAFQVGWLFGFGYFLAGLFWIGEAFLVEADKLGWLMPFAVTLLPAGLAVFWGAAAAAATLFWNPGLSRILALALTLSSAEWLRGHILTGFPWNLIGYTLTSSDVLMQSAALIGTYSLGLWAVLIFATPLVLLAHPTTDTRTSILAATVAPLTIAALFGVMQLSQTPLPDSQNVMVRIVQPNIAQREKWLPDKQGENFRRHLELSRTKPDGTQDTLAGITHVVWPEAAMPFRPLEHPEALDAIDKTFDRRVYLLSGALRTEKNSDGANQVYNSLIVFGPNRGAAQIYDKIHLVPFGEYLPWPWLLEKLGFEDIVKMRGGFASGKSPRENMIVPGLPPALSLICYEAIFPGEAVQSAPRPNFILTVTNDGWFGNTTGPRQHFHQARVRAVEEGLPVIRAANNGISAVIDARGRTRAHLGMNVAGTIDSALPPPLSPPPYARLGDWMFLLQLTLFGTAWLFYRR